MKKTLAIAFSLMPLILAAQNPITISTFDSITCLELKPVNISIRHFDHSRPIDQSITWEPGKKPDYRIVVNAGMFNQDKIPQGYAKDIDHFYNNKINPSYRMFLVGDLNNTHPSIYFADNPDPDSIIDKAVVLQGIRMVSNGHNMWARSDKKWSVVCIGETYNGSMVIFHSRKAWTMHEFIDLVLSHVKLRSLMYLEGGPEASLYYLTDKPHLLWGCYETGFEEEADDCAACAQPWLIPNVLLIN